MGNRLNQYDPIYPIYSLTGYNFKRKIHISFLASYLLIAYNSNTVDRKDKKFIFKPKREDQKMKYFLDSGKIDEIRYAYENYKIDGVTTNPRHIKESGKSFLAVINGYKTSAQHLKLISLHQDTGIFI